GNLQITLQETKKEFTGDYTLVVFPLTRYKLGAPPQIADKLGAALQASLPEVVGYNVIKGFLNLEIANDYWLNFLSDAGKELNWLQNTHGSEQKVVVEYCSPNTNKPLHLGHLRNIVLGQSLSNILKANGYEVIPTCLFNDRGTNISKSMYAWEVDGRELTPSQAGMKGDKLVGDFYVSYSKMLGEQTSALMEKEGLDKKEATKQTVAHKAVQEMTIKWEAGDADVRALWEKMNGWVYTAYEDTFARLGVKYDQYYYESQVYQRGKEAVAEGLEKGLFQQDEDGTVLIDLTEEKLDKKVLLRSNGTSLYITQDLAIAADKYNAFQMDKSIYVVGNEQDYHFKVLFKILEKLGKPYAKGLFHLSYGMVDLPSGKMKSREGTTVEADDLMDDMIAQAKVETQKLGKTEGMSTEELEKLYRTLGIGALKYYLAKVDPKKRMLYDPKESIDLHGHTGPFIQYVYTRTASIRRKAEAEGGIAAFDPAEGLDVDLLEAERNLIKNLYRYPAVLAEAGQTYNPALIANYAYEVAKDYNRFYHEAPVIKAENPRSSRFRFALSNMTGTVLQAAMGLLGIDMPDQM
ncbi:MAG: arginine--tRNA ligase, partial [Bacteroidota bacterium]